MLTIFSAIVGFVGGLAPEVIKFFNAKGDRKHELDIMDKQIQMQKEGATQRLEEVNVQGDIQETVALYKSAETKLTGYKWLDGMIEAYNSGVRPSITYAVLVFYGLHKFEVTNREFTEFDQSTLMLVLGFWFGGRLASKMYGKNKR
jgi:hypothetical protein